MNKIDKMKVDRLIHSLGLKYNLSDKTIKEIVESPYEFAKTKLKELDFEKIESKKEFDKLKTNFIFRSFFKLVVSYKTVKNINYYKKKYKQFKEENNGRS